MQFFPSLLFGISASLDALLVGVSYGIRGIRVRVWQNLLISLVTLLGTCLSVGLGRRFSLFLPEIIRDYAGSLVLIFLGIYYIAKWAASLLRKDPQTECTPRDGTALGRMEYTERPGQAPHDSPDFMPGLKPAEVFSLSLTLSLNNLSAGFSASLAGLTLVPAGISTLACSVLFLSSGNRLGTHPSLQLAGRIADPLSGALLIGLGLFQLL